jgi:hypothetical protein
MSASQCLSNRLVVQLVLTAHEVRERAKPRPTECVAAAPTTQLRQIRCRQRPPDLRPGFAKPCREWQDNGNEGVRLPPAPREPGTWHIHRPLRRETAFRPAIEQRGGASLRQQPAGADRSPAQGYSGHTSPPRKTPPESVAAGGNKRSRPRRCHARSLAADSPLSGQDCRGKPRTITQRSFAARPGDLLSTRAVGVVYAANLPALR